MYLLKFLVNLPSGGEAGVRSGCIVPDAILLRELLKLLAGERCSVVRCNKLRDAMSSKDRVEDRYCLFRVSYTIRTSIHFE